MKPAYVLAALPLLALSCGVGSVKPTIEPGRYVRALKEGDLNRTYILRVPKSYDNRHDVPLVVLLHGWTSNKEQAESYTGFGSESEKSGFVLAIPDGTEGLGTRRGWNCGFLNLGKPGVDDVGFLRSLVESLVRDLHIDRNRVYVVGHSNGAMMAAVAGAESADQIAAIGLVSGSIGIDKPDIPKPKSPISAILIHGKKDDVVPYDRTVNAWIKSLPVPEGAKWWAANDSCGPAVESQQQRGNVVIDDYTSGQAGAEVELVTLLNGTHDWPPTFPAADRIWQFFKSHPKR